jgi:ammonium transporter, Amt family
LFYGDPSQLVAQLIGVGTLVGFVFGLSYAANYVIDLVVGQRVSAEDELAGLDIPEMGALCYPDFVLKPSAISGMDMSPAEMPVALRVAQETA